MSPTYCQLFCAIDSHLDPCAIKTEFGGQALPIENLVQAIDLLSRFAVKDSDVLILAAADELRAAWRHGDAEDGAGVDGEAQEVTLRFCFPHDNLPPFVSGYESAAIKGYVGADNRGCMAT